MTYECTMWKNIWKRERMNERKCERIYEKEGEWTKKINHELLIPQSAYTMIKGENLINQIKEDSMKTRGDIKYLI